MKLFLMSRDEVVGYDCYDSVVVAAKSEDDARTIHPSKYVTHARNGEWKGTTVTGNEYSFRDDGSWVSYSNIKCINVEYLGETDKPRGVILASFNAG